MSGRVAVPREAWAISIERSYEAARASDDTHKKSLQQVPLSRYEPCERCGVLVVTLANKGQTAVVEVLSASVGELWCAGGQVEYRADGSIFGPVKLETHLHACSPVSREQALAELQAALEVSS